MDVRGVRHQELLEEDYVQRVWRPMGIPSDVVQRVLFADAARACEYVDAGCWSCSWPLAEPGSSASDAAC
eukprot:12930086-Prorocentrum_lima.AAC.1